MQEGTRDFMGVSILPGDAEERLEAAAQLGEEEVGSFIARPMDIVVDGEPTKAHVIGYDTVSGIGGPPKVTAGEQVPGPGEIIVDGTLAGIAGIDIGDTVGLAGREFRVAGKSGGGSNLVFTQLVFVEIGQLRAATGAEDITSFVTIDVDTPAQAETLKERIEAQAPGVAVYDAETFVENTRHEQTKTLVPLLIVIVAVGFVVGTTVVGLTIYTLTVERMREYGIMKAVGFTNPDLFRVVIAQSLAAGLVGFALGLGLIAATSRLLLVVLPQFTTELAAGDLLLVFAATIVMAVLAAYAPVRRLARLDPVIVFNP
jgi:putative ABC transport system permease protein